MQYKFFVDGEWRHDEHQPYISGEYGIVNTVLLATEPNFVPVLPPDIVAGSNMDVDNEAFRRVVRVTHTLTVDYEHVCYSDTGLWICCTWCGLKF